MKNLTNLYVYDGKSFPYTTLSDTGTSLTSVADKYINVGNIAPKVVDAYHSNGIVYLSTKSNTSNEMKVLSFSDGYSPNTAVFYIRFNSSTNSEKINFSIAGLQENSSQTVPFGESFSTKNNALVADPMTINPGDTYLCCYLVDRVVVKKIAKPKIESIQYTIPKPSNTSEAGKGPFTITLTDLNSGPNAVFLKTYNGSGLSDVVWISFMFYVVDADDVIGGAWRVYNQNNITATYSVASKALTISGIYGKIPGSTGSTASNSYQLNVFSTQSVY